MTKIIEFTGTPEAGKTTTIHLLKEKLGPKVHVIEESCENMKSYLPRGAKEEALYMVIAMMKDYIEALYQDYDYVLIDRGLYDRYFWNNYSYSRGDITKEKKEERDSFINHPHFDYHADLLVVFKIEPDEAIRRRGGEGRFVTKDRLEKYNQSLEVFTQNFDKTNILEVDTTNLSKEEVVYKILEKI
ncbi:MAG: AAA family ATPase [Bacilli bacterium]|nr:AAA family ATPase [Bacilli bacterium]